MVQSDEQLVELARRLGEALSARAWRVTSAESCTGGWIAKTFTDLPGSSKWFGWGFVSYANDAKTGLLGIATTLIAEHGAVSEPVVRAMAEGARRISGAEMSVAVSGIAGPQGATPGKPVGTVWLAWSSAAGTRSAQALFAGDRDAVRRQAVAAAAKRYGLISVTKESYAQFASACREGS